MNMETAAIDWTGCPIVERVADRMNGVPVLKGTRMSADGVVENYASRSPIEEIAENFGLKEEDIRTILEYAAARRETA
jgi:uncharacterized protein (DUF433 family)